MDWGCSKLLFENIKDVFARYDMDEKRMKELDYAAVGKRIRNARKKLGFSQEVLGKMVGLSTSHVCHVEGGRTKPSLQSIVQIADALHVSVDRILSDNLDLPYDFHREDFLSELRDCSKKEKDYLLQVVIQVKKALRRTLQDGKGEIIKELDAL